MGDDELPVEPEQVPPWTAEDGPPPQVRPYPPSDRPALWVWAYGAWRWAEVLQREDGANGTAYHVMVDLHGDTTVVHRSYRWPQPGLRVALRPAA